MKKETTQLLFLDERCFFDDTIPRRTYHRSKKNEQREFHHTYSQV